MKAKFIFQDIIAWNDDKGKLNMYIIYYIYVELFLK